MKYLDSTRLVESIKQRQRQQVASLIKQKKSKPTLAIIDSNNNPIINVYIKAKQKYAKDINTNVRVYKVAQEDISELINQLNKDQNINGIIVQLPLDQPAETDQILNLIEPKKDVDGLGRGGPYDCPTPTAIIWLLSGYKIDFTSKKIVIIGQGRLVGAPLIKILQKSGHSPFVIDKSTPKKNLNIADIIITATGQANLLKSSDIPKNCVVIDAGTACEQGQIIGDLSADVYNRGDLTLTPKKGGVGPLTVAALFENLILSTITD